MPFTRELVMTKGRRAMNQLGKASRRYLGVLVGVALLGTSAIVSGQDSREAGNTAGEIQAAAASSTSRTFGTANSTAHVIFASEFDPIDNATVWNYVASPPAKWASKTLYAGVRLPAGAVVQSVELEGCDSSTLGEVSFAMFRTASPGGSEVPITPTGGTGVPTLGCTVVAVAPLPAVTPLVIDNEGFAYYLKVETGAVNKTLRAVRVYYNLEVTPAPAVATFQDVPPGSQFFQYIEALAKSGITSGCTTVPPQFCPDAPLTRGQMATFLSKALGLHFVAVGGRRA
jgi:hypothetical protein